MRLVEIVTHAYSVQHPDYARALTFQLSTLMHWFPRRCHFVVTVCTTEDDTATRAVADNFAAMLNDMSFHDRQCVRLLLAEPSRVLRRGILRNEAGKASKADVVWYADADYGFSEGCLDALVAAEFIGLAYPKQVMIHRAHHLGDAELARITPGELFQPDMSLFVPKKEKFPTGGIIIVDGDTARKGYMDGTKWTEPVDPSLGFIDPREDVAYRKQFGGATALDLPNVLRFRHSACPFQSAEERLAQTAHIQ